MGCKSDHMEPTLAEKACQQAAEFIVYVNGFLGAPTAEAVMKASSNLYCNDRTLEPMLCGILNDWKGRDLEGFEAFIYDGRKAMHRSLAAWYQQHEASDKRRVKKEARVEGIQDAINEALAQAKGFADVDTLLEYVDRNERGIDGKHQDRVNHAFAVIEGFNNVDDFLAAKGMRGNKATR